MVRQFTTPTKNGRRIESGSEPTATHCISQVRHENYSDDYQLIRCGANLNSLLYHALYILLYRPNLSSTDASVRSASLTTCVFHSKEIHSKFAIYERTFPNRMMTYQVSYCVFTAASVDAYAIKTLCGDGVHEAVRRLGDAMRVLQNEERHTPGIGRTLSTIRRQLATWKSERKVRTRGEGNASFNTPAVGDQTATELHQAQRTRLTEGLHAGQKPTPAQPPGEAPQELFDYFLGSGSQTLTGPAFGGIDTGAGFHPDAFPWSVIDNTAEQAWSQPSAEGGGLY